MKATVYDRFGEADVLRLADVPHPEVRPTDLLVRVRAAGVNRADLLQRQGYYGDQTYGESDLLGLELSGEIVDVGRDVKDFRVGERVMAIVGGGAYAEYARVDQDMAVRIPQSIGDVEAAAIMESFVTAWEAVAHLGEARLYDVVLVHAAAGGIGSAAVQVAHALGARVLATTTSNRVEDVRSLGAEAAFDYASEDFEARVRELTAGGGADVIVDFVGGDYAARNLRSLAAGGRLVQVGLLSGQDNAEIPLSLLLHNHLRIIGTVMKSRDAADKRAMIRRFADQALPLFREGRLRPIIGQTFSLSEAADAHRYMEAGGGFGKVVLTGL